MKNLLNLEGVKALSRMEQKSVLGGYVPEDCPSGQIECLCNHVFKGCAVSQLDCINMCE